MASKPIYTVTQVNTYIKSILDGDRNLSGVYIRGEISNYKKYPSGHHYFTLKDTGGALRCVLFRSSATRLRFQPESGMKVIAYGRITAFPRDGQYQLYVDALTPDGVGELYVAFEQLKNKLYQEGFFAAEHKKPIPRYCEAHNDIVTCFDAGTAEALIGFCQGIQAASPVDSYAAPEPSPEPGYTDEVVMASGSFTQGSTIELSCDGPLRAPYTCYLQGGLNFAASRAGVLLAVQKAYFKE